MTVKKRLARSNTLMIILPIAISLLLTWILMGIVDAAMNTDRQRTHDDTFELAVTAALRVAGDWPDDVSLERIQADLSELPELKEKVGLSLVVYQNGSPLYESNIIRAEPAAMLQDGRYTSENEVYVLSHADYSIQLSYTSQHLRETLPNTSLLIFWPLAALTVFALVFLTNRFLTRYVFRYIIDPLNILVEGVQELKNGNLAYRIEYHGKDEFAAVCDEFNLMARQLSELIRARERDDEERRVLIAGISHDLRTPLTSIRAYVEGIEHGVAATPARQAEYLDVIKRKTDDLEHIVGQLFQYSKLDVGAFPFAMERVDIGLEIKEYVQLVADEYEQRGLVVSLGENTRGLFSVVDTVQLRAVFTNILENAVKYGRDTDKRMLVQCRAESGQACLIFRDNGNGIAEEALDKLFSAFYRNDSARQNPGKGSGLGLAISAKIIERFGGAIHAENAAGGGLAIHIALPLAQEGDEA